METKNFNSNSFIYRFLAWPEAFLPNRRRPTDICDLRRAVIVKLIFCLLLTGLLFMYFYVLASAGLYGLSKISTFFLAYSTETPIVRLGLALSFATALLAGFTGFIFGFVWCYSKVCNYLDNRKDEREGAGLKPLLYPVVNPIKELYQSWKDKLCYRVSFD